MPLPHQLTELTVIPNDNHHDLVMYNDDKRYLPHMPCPLQIIQLVEVAAPPRRIPSSYYSSSRSSSSDSESICSSYCSSNNVDEAVQDHQRFNKLALIPQSADDDYALRMKRILAWRENFSAYLSVTISDGGLSSSLKRKLQCEDNDSDTMSRSSKRSRSQASSEYTETTTSATTSSLGHLACPACDAFFDSPQSLRDHGRAKAGVNEACLAAVEYAFES